MSNETIPDPARFSRPAEPEHRTSGGGRALSAIALLALVVGVPVALWLLAGTDPFPTSLPTKETLTEELSFTTLLNVLLFVVWLAWLFFVVCVVVEVVAARRGGLAQPVPLGGPVQKLARALVGALLLAEVISGPAASAMAPAEHTGGEVAASVVRDTPQAAPDAEQTKAERRAAHEITAQEHLVGHKVYTVAAPKDGYHDNLWDIAERSLGDGRRYREIYELNKGLVQPDGRKLELARLIQPGWNLVVPEDAVGVQRWDAPPKQATPAPDTHRFAPGQAPEAMVSEQAVQEMPGGLLGTGLLTAAVLAALAFERRRRIGAASRAAAVEAELRGAATPSRAAFLDRALRDLTAACRAESQPLPPVYAVRLDDTTVSLLLAPAAATPVGEWRTEDDGATWVRDHFEDADDRLVDEVVAYPALVSLGIDVQGCDVLVDLESAGGVVALEGDPHVASEVAAAIALQSGTASWATGMRVTASGLPNGLVGLGDDRIRVVEDLSAEVAGLEQSLDSVRADVLTGRLDRRTTQPSRLVVVGEQADDELAERLVGLTGPERQSLSVLLAGGHRAARWTLHVDSGGHLRLDELGITVTANRIGYDQIDGIAALFEAAREPDRPDDGGQVHIPSPLRAVDDAAWTTAPRRVGVLGTIAVTGVPAAEEARSDQLAELVIYLALHPEGVHPNVLAGVLWPRGVTPDVSAAVGQPGPRLARRRRARATPTCARTPRAGSRSATVSSATGTPCARCSCVPGPPARAARRWSCCAAGSS